MEASTKDNIGRAVSICPDFKDGNESKRIYWVYKFLKRSRLSTRAETRVSQITDPAMQPVKRDSRLRIMT